MDDEDNVKRIVCCGILSPHFDWPVLNNARFDKMVFDLEERGIIAVPEARWMN